MREAILNTLHCIEDEYDVTILHAVESGSRAWGFASEDSDWDVRFIYRHKRDKYLSVFKWRDVIEHSSPIWSQVDRERELDISGWDLRKTMGLLYKSNPPLLEHMRSPIVYIDRKEFAPVLGLVSQVYSPRVCVYHYYHMARNNYREYLRGPGVWLKKYLYVVRPVMCMEWIQAYGSLPPVNIYELMSGLDLEEELCNSILDLLERKKSGSELTFGSRIAIISEYLKEKLEKPDFAKEKREDRKEMIDEVFMEVLGDD